MEGFKYASGTGVSGFMCVISVFYTSTSQKRNSNELVRDVFISALTNSDTEGRSDRKTDRLWFINQWIFSPQGESLLFPW